MMSCDGDSLCMLGPPSKDLQTMFRSLLFQHFDHNISKSLLIAYWEKKVLIFGLPFQL